MEKYEPFETYYNNKLDQLRQEDEKRISALEAERIRFMQQRIRLMQQRIELMQQIIGLMQQRMENL